MLLLNHQDIEQCVDLPGLVRALEDAHRGFSSVPPVVPKRLMITHQREGAFSLFMPALLPEQQTLGIKVSSFHPGNSGQGLSSVNGAVLLIDPETGRLLAMLDSAALTAIRTSAMSALATDKLCPRERLNLTVIGAGAQAAAHVRAMADIRDLGQVRIVSRRLAQSTLLAERLSTELRLPIEAVDSVPMALADADIICTTTSHTSPTPLVTSQMLKPLVHINAVGGSTLAACEIDPYVLADALVHVDHLDSARHESAEIAQALALSVISECEIRQISTLVIDQPAPPKQKSGWSYFRSVGHASQDMVVANRIYEIARARGIGRYCDYFNNPDMSIEWC
ncbi:ornithine cyclodeaminase family protein [Pseudomonas entomophila]|uniref:ornithine cyclodeaminase family protein n=1 Tax=Pseudomonas entomophila TaxID=312306 RepID=UPI001BCC955A|nr:ornithine cyclodeaminase family protein [Pseudomonas entomophila]QVM89196.1 ornithine cyclodeaminase family protein [Pseudomonas entomophila]